MAMHATLWLDQQDLFVEEHVEEWEAQKSRTCALNDLEWDTEVIYRACIIKRQEDKGLADSKEEAAKELPNERQVTHAERQAGATPIKADMTSTSTGSDLYPNWFMRHKTKTAGRDVPKPYRMPREGADGGLMLEMELSVDSVFDPLQPASQSSQSDAQCSSTPDTILRVEGWKGPEHRNTTARCQPISCPSTWLGWAYCPGCCP